MKSKVFFLNVVVVFIAFAKAIHAQPIPADSLELANDTLSFPEYIGYVKRYHPMVSQANLDLSIAEASLLRARGGFDPKVSVDKDRKKFKDTEYFDELNAMFKIPTWYGVEFKAAFEENSGQFLDPSLTVPEDGLYSAGVSLSLAEGLLTNKRMASLRKAKFFLRRSRAERQLMINDLLFEASLAYFEWLGAEREQQVYKEFYDNARVRARAVARSAEVGFTAGIDSVEATIAVQNRLLGLQQARLKSIKARLDLSTYLWIEDVPVILRDSIKPSSPESDVVAQSLLVTSAQDSLSILNNHPKLRALALKQNELEVERNLRRNMLLPTIDVQYNFLTPEVNGFNSFDTEDYKFGLRFSTPLFLRKERGELKIANARLSQNQLEQKLTEIQILNKVQANENAIDILEEQLQTSRAVVENYRTLLSGEERKFELGESSLFLVNSREQSLVNARLKLIEIYVKRLSAISELFNTLGTEIVPIEE